MVDAAPFSSAASGNAGNADDRLAADGATLWPLIGRVVAAHVVMLREAGVLDDAAAAAVLTALDGVTRGVPAGDQRESPGTVGLIAAFEGRLDALTARGAVGAGALGRARIETAAAIWRLTLRDDLLAAMAATAAARRSLLNLAGEQVFTLMPTFAGSQAVQPTNLAHFLGGTIAPLARAAERLRAAYAEVNRGPLGAGALASTGVPIDRERAAALLGCDGTVAGSFDAVAAVDHLALAAETAAAIAATLRRLLSELLTWRRADPESFRLGKTAAPVVDPGLPGFRPPVALERLVADARRLEADAASVVRLVAEAPYGPAVAALDDGGALASATLRGTAALAERTAGLVAALEVNRAYLAHRAGRDHTTSGDLALFLIGEEGLDAAAAREITLMTVRRAIEQGLEASGITPQMIDGAALLVIGRELGIEVENLGHWLAPRRYLERRGASGGPAPAAVRDDLTREREVLLADERWREERHGRLASAAAELERAIAEITAATD